MGWYCSKEDKPRWAGADDEVLFSLTVSDLAGVHDGLIANNGSNPLASWDLLPFEVKRRMINQARRNLDNLEWSELVGYAVADTTSSPID